MSYNLFASLLKILKNKAHLNKMEILKIKLNYIFSPIWTGFCFVHRITSLNQINAMINNDKNILIKNVLFSSTFYEMLYVDVKNSKLNPWRHFYSWGVDEYRSPQPYLDLFGLSGENKNLNGSLLFWDTIKRKKIKKFFCFSKNNCGNYKLFINDLNLLCNQSTHVDYRRNLIHHIFAHLSLDNECKNIKEENFIMLKIDNFPKYIYRIVDNNLVETEKGWVILNPDNSQETDSYYCTKDKVFFFNNFEKIEDDLEIIYFTNIADTYEYICQLDKKKIILLGIPDEFKRFKEILIEKGFELVKHNMVEFMNKIQFLKTPTVNKELQDKKCFVYKTEKELNDFLESYSGTNNLFIIAHKKEFTKTEILMQLGEKNSNDN